MQEKDTEETIKLTDVVELSTGQIWIRRKERRKHKPRQIWNRRKRKKRPTAATKDAEAGAGEGLEEQACRGVLDLLPASALCEGGYREKPVGCDCLCLCGGREGSRGERAVKVPAIN